jgi:hypothetical protein
MAVLGSLNCANTREGKTVPDEIDAVKQRRFAAIEQALKQGHISDGVDTYGRTQFRSATLLIDAPAYIRVSDYLGNSPAVRAEAGRGSLAARC